MTMAQSRPMSQRAPQSKAEKILRAFHEEERYVNIYDSKLAVRLWGYLVPYRALLIGAVVLIVVTALMALARPLVMKHAIDDVILGGEGLMAYGALLLLVLGVAPPVWVLWRSSVHR